MVNDGMACSQRFIFIQVQSRTLAISVEVHERKNQKDRGVAHAIDHEESRYLGILDHLAENFRGHRFAATQATYGQSEQKLQRVNIKKHHEQEYRVKQDGV